MNNKSLQSSWLIHNLYGSFSEIPAIDELCLDKYFSFFTLVSVQIKKMEVIYMIETEWPLEFIQPSVHFVGRYFEPELGEIFSFFIWKLSCFPLEKKIDWLKFSTGFSAQTAMFREKDPCMFALVWTSVSISAVNRVWWTV